MSILWLVLISLFTGLTMFAYTAAGIGPFELVAIILGG